MRVLLTVHQFFPKHYSGTEVLARDAGLELLARGHEVHVLTTDPSADGNSVNLTHKDYEYRGLKVHSLELPKRRAPLGSAGLLDVVRDEYCNDSVAEDVRRYVRRIEPDVVHMFHLLYLSASLLEVFRGLGVPLIFTATDFWAICVRGSLAKPSGELCMGPDDISSNCLECREVENLLPPREHPDATDKQEFYRKVAERALVESKDEHENMPAIRAVLARTNFLRRNLNSVDAILAPTDFMRRMLTMNGIDPELLVVSPYGMDISYFRSAEYLRSGTNGLRVGYISGVIEQRKGLRVLIEAFKKLPTDWGGTLRVCGDLRGNPEYARETYELAGGDPRINFAGPYPSEMVGVELGKIDVLVVPSIWYENAPLVIYSALTAGVPVVASNLGGMSELVRHEENGLLFEFGDSEDLARQLERLISEPGLLAKLRQNTKGVRTVEDSVDEMLALYEDLRRSS